MRILQGVAIGGEVPGAWVFVAEHVPEHRFGLGIGTLTAGLTTGILMGSLMAGAINTDLRPGRRRGVRLARSRSSPAALFGFVSVYLRRFLEETPVFQEMQARRALAREVPIKTVLSEHRAATLLALALTWVLTAAIVVVILFTPMYLQQVFHVPAHYALQANTGATITFIAGCLFFGWSAISSARARR